jgi:hypothetical protein
MPSICLKKSGLTEIIDYHAENFDRINDKVLQDSLTGTNANFMSYATYDQVRYDPAAILDPQILLKTSQRVFATFFQHFVSSNISHEFDRGSVSAIRLDSRCRSDLEWNPNAFDSERYNSSANLGRSFACDWSDYDGYAEYMR